MDVIMDQLHMIVSGNKENRTTLKREKFVMSESSQDMADSSGNIYI
jgi:hypothetical protein